MLAKAARQWRTASAALAASILVLALPALALAHLERPSYWPDPAPDSSVSPAAGGKVPHARSLASAVDNDGPGQVFVVCQGKNGKDSLDRLKASLDQAQDEGYRLRPSQPVIHVSKNQAKRLLKINKSLAKRCAYDSVQKAVFAAGNNDRVVIMPGLYEEPDSRAKPKNDPKCVPSLLQKDASGDLAPSYRYQVTCPNDQNLIYVQGRALAGDPPQPPLKNRQGIPASELGPCVRCNFQIEGSGVKPEDVIMDGGTNYSGPEPTAKPGGYAKDVVLRVDRADGFVGRNFLVRGAEEHGFYNEEVDGILLDRVKFYWAADYGHLSFTSDHNLVENCEGFGAGDSVVYPGAAPETGSQATSFYKDAPRYNTTIRKCDLHGSALGYSGSMGNAVRITNNHIYGNTTGISSDTLSAAGHPGVPADSSEIDHNFIYSNNLNLFIDHPQVDPLVTVPVGTGIIYPGMNDARVHHNWIFDNWRNGAMLFSIPDAFTNGGGAEGDIFPGVSCPGAPQNGFSTSCGNRFYDNNVGRAPRGFKFPGTIDLFGNAHAADDGRRAKLNGNDFWWGEFFPINTANCWFDNKGWDGTAATVTGPGQAGRLPASLPQILPSNCGTSTGFDDQAKLNYLVECSNGPDTDTGPTDCDWWSLPARPPVPPTDGQSEDDD
ncbi:MAG TPA: right-handed parallel beta-helix repeat-containing protein [Solirubrobacteraceae bacterium]|nr:right-handed parallel beta-helix repeat-containing protein [Solirubrobacteraceae bacterium]